MILTTSDEFDRPMTAPVVEALVLRRPLPDEAPQIVAWGTKKDGASDVC